MKLAHFFIDHPRFAAVINIFIALAGLATMAFLPIAQYPNIVPPTIDITTTFPGASAETIARTTLGTWRPGTLVNLERALALGDRLGGHLVAGHVDAVGEVVARVPEGQGVRLTVSLPAAIAPLVAEKGSVAVDGVSLTVARALRDRFELALIPETLARTTLGAAIPGTRVNLEADVVARHVARLVELGAAPDGLEPGALARWGYGGGAA